MAKTVSDASQGFYRAVLDAIPSPVLVVEEDVRIVSYNAAAAGLLSGDATAVLHRRAGEALRCLHSTESPDGCGRGPVCLDCVVRQSVNQALEGKGTVRRKARMEIVSHEQVTPIFLLVTATPLQYEGRDLVLVLLENIGELISLHGLLPICAGCKKIRSEDGYWHHLESYFESHLDVDFTHGLCPDCIKRLYPEYADDED